MVFLDWKSDVGFKWLFGRQEVSDHLEAFLLDIASEVNDYSFLLDLDKNEVEEFSGGLKLEMLNIELPLWEKRGRLKRVFLDLYIRLPNGMRVILEMQKVPHKGLDRRMFGYLLRAIDNSGGVPHVLIALINFKLSMKWGTQVKDSVVSINKAFDGGELLTAELGRFNKTLEQSTSRFDIWMFLFKNINKLEEVPEILKGTIFEKIMEMSRIKSLPKEPLEDWKKEILEDVYIQEAIEIYSEQALEEGIEKGLKEGRNLGRKEAIMEKEEATIQAYQKGKKDGIEIAKNEITQLIREKLQKQGLNEDEINELLHNIS